MKFRKKPIVIEAVQWNGHNLRSVTAFTEQYQTEYGMSWVEYEDLVATRGLKIFTLEGPFMASVGDWIIKGVQGEFYPCKTDIFYATYEPVEDAE